MNGKSENSSNWSWFWNSLLLAFIIGFLAIVAKPNFIGGGPNEEPSPILNNLRQISSAEIEWAYEHSFTNESQVLQLTNHLTQTDLFPYIHHDPDKTNNLVQSAAGEIYTIGGFNAGPEAKLTKKLKLRNENWPKGTIIRLVFDPDNGMPYQVIFPDGTKKDFHISK